MRRLPGLDTVPRENWPPVPITFWSFRIMVGLGFLMLGLGLLSLWARWRGTLYECRLLHLFAMAMGPAGFIAVLAGWFTTEVGRQPFTVYGLLRTAESASPLAAPAVGSSLIAFVIVYFIVYAAGLIYIVPVDGTAAASRRSRDRAATSRPAPPASRPRPAWQRRDPPDDRQSSTSQPSGRSSSPSRCSSMW